MPFDGQHSSKTAEAAKPVAQPVAGQHEAKIIVKQQPVNDREEEGPVATMVVPIVKPSEPVVRKKMALPGAKLSTATLGIKSILDPPKNKQAENEGALLPDMAENFTFDELKRVWNEFALDLKREKKDSLYSTLTDSELTVTSDYKITLEISNSAQAIHLEREKAGLLDYLRSKLRNYQISFAYKISDKPQMVVKDNKSTFEKLAAENPSLHKLRKMFNLDIDY